MLGVRPGSAHHHLSGHGHFDMAAYDKYFSGQLEDYEYPEAAVADSMQRLPKVG
ncbi:MAG: hypothetical protein HZA69_03580 [Gammaproteobacteria bacterium]|nr:hypothetical protein [Gammaproteobacteria bacterium]